MKSHAEGKLDVAGQIFFVLFIVALFVTGIVRNVMAKIAERKAFPGGPAAILSTKEDIAAHSYPHTHSHDDVIFPPSSSQKVLEIWPSPAK